GAVQPRMRHRIMESASATSVAGADKRTTSPHQRWRRRPVRWLDRCGDDAATVSAIHDLLVDSRSAAALRAAERAVRSVTNPYAAASAHLGRVGALVNLGRTTQYAAAVEEAFAAVRALREPYPHGHLHALAALAARQQGALERSL